MPSSRRLGTSVRTLQAQLNTNPNPLLRQQVDHVSGDTHQPVGSQSISCLVTTLCIRTSIGTFRIQKVADVPGEMAFAPMRTISWIDIESGLSAELRGVSHASPSGARTTVATVPSGAKFYSPDEGPSARLSPGVWRICREV